MLLPAKLICRTKRVHEDGTCTIFIQYCYADKKVLLHTGIKVPPSFWNRKQQCVIDSLPAENGVAAELNNELLRMRSVVNALALKARAVKTEERGIFIKASFSTDLVPDNVEKKISEKQNTEKKRQQDILDVYYPFDEYIKSKQRKVGRATLTVYNNVKSHLLAFEEYRKQKITFSSFDFGFYEDFVDYLTFEHIHLRRIFISAAALTLSLISLIVTLVQKNKETKRTIRKNLSDTLESISKIAVESAKLRASKETDFNSEAIILLRRNYNSQRRILIAHANYLIERYDKISTEIDCNILAGAYATIGDMEGGVRQEIF